jgi:haloacetate dehalogenase
VSERSTLELDDGAVHYRLSGAGDRLVVLLHGWPQTGRCWDAVAETLAARFRVLVPDLRDYSASRCTGTDFSKHAAARDLATLVDHLGFDTTAVVGHDRGARVAHRWALDSPALVTRLALLDILPTRGVIHGLNEHSSKFLWHWFLHLQPGIAETLLAGNTDPYLRYFFENQSLDPAAISPSAVDDHIRAYSDPGVLHTTLEDYRASFTIDLEMDDDDFAAGRLVRQLLLLLWGAHGGLADSGPTTVWARYATDVRGAEIEACKHILPEEQPEVVAARLTEFLA